MLLDDLVLTKQISYQEAQVYKLFAVSDLGREWLATSTHETFMDCVPPPMMTTEILGYTDGRRSIFRDIHEIINKVQTKMAKADA